MRVYCNTTYKGCFTVDAFLVEKCLKGIEIVHKGTIYYYSQHYIKSLNREFDIILNKNVYRFKKNNFF